MGLFSKKDSAANVDKTKAHGYKAPAQPPSSGHIACQICGRAPDDMLHDVPKNAIDSEMRWS